MGYLSKAANQEDPLEETNQQRQLETVGELLTGYDIVDKKGFHVWRVRTDERRLAANATPDVVGSQDGSVITKTNSKSLRYNGQVQNCNAALILCRRFGSTSDVSSTPAGDPVELLLLL